MPNRRTVVIAIGLAALQLPAAASTHQVKLYRDPSCHCCDLYARHLEENGFDVDLIDATDMAPIKQKYGVPESLEGCHTAVVDGYVLEGLIPAKYVAQMLRERPAIKGLSVPGMPTGAPGMPGAKSKPLNVYVIDTSTPPKVFASF